MSPDLLADAAAYALTSERIRVPLEMASGLRPCDPSRRLFLLRCLAADSRGNDLKAAMLRSAWRTIEAPR